MAKIKFYLDRRSRVRSSKLPDWDEQNQRAKKSCIDYESQKYRTIIHLLKNFPDKEVKLRVIDYRERIK